MAIKYSFIKLAFNFSQYLRKFSVDILHIFYYISLSIWFYPTVKIS